MKSINFLSNGNPSSISRITHAINELGTSIGIERSRRLNVYKYIIVCTLLVVHPNVWAATCDHSLSAIGKTTFVIRDAGNWCVNSDLQYTGTQSAIKVVTDNVSIYFNGNRLDGPASPHSQALGIEVEGSTNIKIVGNVTKSYNESSGGTIAGFLRGISAIGGSELNIRNMMFEDNYQHGICVRDIAGVSISNNIIERTGGHALTGDDIRSFRNINCGSSAATIGIAGVRGSNVRIVENQISTTIRNRLNRFYAYGIVANSAGALVKNNRVTNTQNIGIMTNLGYDSNSPGLGANLIGNVIWNNGDFQTFCQLNPVSAAYDLHNGIRMSGHLDIYSGNDVRGFYQPFWRGVDGGSNYDNSVGNDGGSVRICSLLNRTRH